MQYEIAKADSSRQQEHSEHRPVRTPDQVVIALQLEGIGFQKVRDPVPRGFETGAHNIGKLKDVEMYFVVVF